MDKLFFVSAFVGVFSATCRSLGWGFLAVTVIGYFSGVIRANFLGAFTAFMFDAAVLGLYAGFIQNKSRWTEGVDSRAASRFVLLLMVWPALLCLAPVNHLLVQLVALRSVIWFLPVLLIATRLNSVDLSVLSRGFAVLNLVALVVGIYVYIYGVESLYPRNDITLIIYRSADVGGRIKTHRVPSSFLSAHAYGGTMMLTLPFLLDRFAGVGVRICDRGLAAAGIVAAGGGILMCGARSPVVVLMVAISITWLLSRFSLKLALVLAIVLGGGYFVASNDERLQRGASAADMDVLTSRLQISTNDHFLELLFRYPLGAGMGSAVGTSIPFFLAHLAPEQIGLENEYSRILVEQGWPGLAGWLAFLVWLFALPPSTRPPAPWRLGVVFMYALTLASWTSAVTGTGILTSVPGTFIRMTEMGLLIVVRSQGRIPELVDLDSDPCDEDFSSPVGC